MAGGVQIGTIILGNNVIMPRRMEVTPEGPVTQQIQSLRETCTSMFTVFFLNKNLLDISGNVILKYILEFPFLKKYLFI